MHHNSISLCLTTAFALTFCCIVLIAPPPTLGSSIGGGGGGGNMENIKSELRDGQNLNGGGGGGSNTLNGAGGGSGNFFSSAGRRSLRSIYGLGPKMLQISRSKIPIELDLLVENDDGERSKRFDDYGHMRFGKRGGEEQFDDYGHMRFGRSM